MRKHGLSHHFTHKNAQLFFGLILKAMNDGLGNGILVVVNKTAGLLQAQTTGENVLYRVFSVLFKMGEGQFLQAAPAQVIVLPEHFIATGFAKQWIKEAEQTFGVAGYDLGHGVERCELPK
jgi:hypothetical protein